MADAPELPPDVALLWGRRPSGRRGRRPTLGVEHYVHEPLRNIEKGNFMLENLWPRYRDIAIIWSVFSTALFYATPIFYGIQQLAGHPTIQHIFMINPLAPIFELARKWIIDPNAPGPVASGGPAALIIPLALFAGIAVLAGWLFNREAPRIAEEL